MDLCFLAFGKSLGYFISAMVFFFVFVNPVSVDSLSAVTLNGHSRDFVVPRLLNLHPCLG